MHSLVVVTMDRLGFPQSRRRLLCIFGAYVRFLFLLPMQSQIGAECSRSVAKAHISSHSHHLPVLDSGLAYLYGFITGRSLVLHRRL
ncbi:uncharacterized protein EV420DRAFT_1171238 [Desarmillaria tabescens]|uniref:Uncharacterized protein n=1 Tax=Armillaria tabescens TaxID=1929756 RepID=A0AA39MN39_ARMTA|nr:uncharacterized protein EV420DRAFT_1171238 [Desarmillaria tabescens]KAK0439520.1 hypothetical protein EV420DRAFT_1171238 [Desarmillaria tabescens]